MDDCHFGWKRKFLPKKTAEKGPKEKKKKGEK